MCAIKISKRRFRYVLIMAQEQIQKIALHWSPHGRRKPGRPKRAKRRIYHNLMDMGTTWKQAQHMEKKGK